MHELQFNQKTALHNLMRRTKINFFLDSILKSTKIYSNKHLRLHKKNSILDPLALFSENLTNVFILFHPSHPF